MNAMVNSIFVVKKHSGVQKQPVSFISFLISINFSDFNNELKS